MPNKAKYLGKVHNEPIETVDTVDWDGEDRTRVTLHCSEFTAFCPVTNQPDFGTIKIEYSPVKKLIETKSLKLYLWSFRKAKAFNEVLISRITRELFKVVEPLWIKVTGVFNPRGGINVEAESYIDKYAVPIDDPTPEVRD